MSPTLTKRHRSESVQSTCSGVAASTDAGYSAEEIKTATIGCLRCGKESDMWKQWVADFERLLSLSDPRIAEIGRLGYSEAVERRDAALMKERMEDVYGER